MLLFKAAFLCLSLIPHAAQNKRVAIQSPTCVIPMGQIVDKKDLQRRDLREDWMKPLDGKLRLSQISIPATHDAGTALGKTGWTRCQCLTIPAQLAMGVRGFDIRLRLVDHELSIYHSEESQSLKFSIVMAAFESFLKKHPREFLVMRVREESKAIRPSETFEQAFARYRPEKLFYRAPSRTDIPTVEAARGKIVLLDNYGKLPDAIDYPNPTMGVQDDYDTSDMAKKYEEIVGKFQDALDEKNGSVWNVNYTSSSTVQVDQLANAVAVNPKVNSFLSGKRGHLGLVFVNFLGPVITREIVDSNF